MSRPRADCLRVMADHVREVEQVGEHRLRNGGGGICRNVCDGDAATPGRGHVYDVVPRGQNADVAQQWEGGDRAGVDRRFVGQDNRGLARPEENLLRARPFIRGAFAKRGEGVPTKVAGIQGVLFKNNNLHGRRKTDGENVRRIPE